MADNTTRLKILAQVEGVQGFDSLKRSLQGLAQQGQQSGRSLDRLYTSYQQLSGAGKASISSLRLQATALAQLRDQAELGSRKFRILTQDLERVEKQLQQTTRATRGAAPAVGGGMGLAGALVTGGGIRGALSMQAGEAAMAGRLALAGGITAGMAAAAGAGAIAAGSVSTARDVATEQRKVSTLTNDTKALNDAIADLVRSQGYMTSQASATSAAYEILSSGFSRTGDVIKILNASTNGAVGGFSDIKTVADATTGILNGYGRSADDARRVVDMMIQTQNDGKIVVGEYAQSIGRLVPMAAMANISLEEVNGAISALTAQGVPIESTFSGISQAIKSIIKPTDEARQMAAKLGLDFSASALSAKGFGGFLADVTAKTKGNSAALGILFSDIDGYKAVVALTNDKLKRFNEFTVNQAKAINTSSTAAEKAVDPFERYANANKDLGNAMGKVLLPPLTKVTQLMTSLIKALMTNGLPERMKGFGEFMKGAIINTLPGGALLRSGSNLLDLNVEPPPPPPRDGRTDLPKPKPILPSQKIEDKAITDLANLVLSGGAEKPSAEDLILKKPYGAQIIAAARKKGLDPALFAGLIAQESGFRPTIKSKAGAIGLGQLMPGTAADLGVNPYDPVQNLAGAAQYLSRMIGQYGLTGGLRAYNQGPGNQELYPQGVSAEARAYPGAVLAQAKRFGYDDKSGIKSAELQMTALAETQKLAEQRAKEQKDTIERNQKLAEQAQQQEDSYFASLQTTKDQARLLGTMTEGQRLLEEFANNILDIERDIAKAKADALTEDAASLAVADGELRKQNALNKLYQDQAALKSSAMSESWAQQQETLQGTLTSYYQQQADLLGEQGQLAVSLSQSIGQGLQQAFGLAIQGTEDWGASLKNLASGVLQDIAQQLLQIAVITPIINSIAGIGARGIAPIAPGISALPGGDFTGAFTGGGGGMSFTGGLPAAAMTPGAFQFATGGIMTPDGAVPLRRYARGGIATAPQAAIYGEGATPEAFVPLPDGRRIPVALRQYPGIPGTPGAAGSFEQTDAVVQRLVETARQESAVRAATSSTAGPDGTMRIQIETTRINSVDYVTAEQAQALAQAAATRSTARQQRALQGSPAARRSVGI